MRDNLAAFKTWAPDDVFWSQWAKPVLFTQSPQTNYSGLYIPELQWISRADYNTMVIVDLQGEESVAEGIALARIGYRPVPLYNGVSGPSSGSMVINVSNLVLSLFDGANLLNSLNLRHDAPPAFLLDSRRMNSQGRQPGKYDNRWCIFPQDMPSAACLQRNGITNIVVRADKVRDDLAHILYRYQEKGIGIRLCGGTTLPREKSVTRPSKFRGWFYRCSVLLGLTRNATGGFGGIIPEPSSGRSG